MKKNLVIIMLITISLVFIGCNQSNNIQTGINDFTISYLNIRDDKYLVENEVSISIEEDNANSIQLLVQESGQDKIETTIEGEKSGGSWLFTYSNNDPFTKEIWLVATYDDGKEVSDKKVITNQSQNYESAFENIIQTTSDENKITLLNQKTNLMVFGWLDNENILAQDNYNLISYDFYNNEKNILYENIWNVYPSPDFKNIIYQTEDGLHVSNIEKRDSKKILELKESEVLKDLAWSRTQRQVIINIMEDQKNVFHLIDLTNNKVETLNVDIGEYTIEKLVYLDNTNLYALGKIRSKEASDTEIEKSKALISINITNGRVKNYTPNLQPMDELKVLSQVNDREFLVRISNTIVSEEEITTTNGIYLLNTQSRVLKNIKENIDFPYVYNLSSNKDGYIYLKNIEEEGNKSSKGKTIVLGKEKGEEIDILKAVEHYPSTFHWSKNREKIVFYIDNTKEIYLIIG